LVLLTAEGATAFDRASGMRASGDFVHAISSLKPRRGARILVAAESVFTQTVRLPAAQTAALSPAELESALFYEVEPFCGVRREEAVVGVDRLAEGEWRVSVADRAELASLRDRVRALHGRFAGVTALPREAAADDPAALLDSLFPAEGPGATILQPPRGGVDAHALATGAGIAVILLAVLCAFDYLWLTRSARRLRPVLAEAENLAAANAQIKREIQTDRDKVKAIEEAHARREAAIAGLATSRDRWHALLATLAGTGNRAVIRSIAADDPQQGAGLVDAYGEPLPTRTANPAQPRGARIEGLAASPADAADAMARLSAALASKGWRLVPDTVAERPGGSAVSFSFRVTPAGKGGR